METATSISLAFNLFLAVFLVYLDWSRRRELRDKDEIIKDVTLKFMSRSTGEYLQAKGEPPENTKETPDRYVDLEDVRAEKLLEAEDLT